MVRLPLRRIDHGTLLNCRNPSYGQVRTAILHGAGSVVVVRSPRAKYPLLNGRQSGRGRLEDGASELVDSGGDP